MGTFKHSFYGLSTIEIAMYLYVVMVRDLTLMMKYVKRMSTLTQDGSINLHLSSTNFTLFALKRSTSQNPEISGKFHYLFVELTTMVKLIIPMKVNIRPTHFSLVASPHQNPVSIPANPPCFMVQSSIKSVALMMTAYQLSVGCCEPENMLMTCV